MLLRQCREEVEFIGHQTKKKEKEIKNQKQRHLKN